MKDSGIAQWVPAGNERSASDQGLVKLDDRVFQPRLQGDANAAGFGRLEPGNWYAPEPAARIFNHYMSRGLAGQSIIYDTVRVANNALNSLQLGLSGFHATFVTLDTAISRAALGLDQMTHGQFLRGSGNFAFGTIPGLNLASVVKTVREGAKLRSAWLDPAAATPEWQTLAEDLNRGGGRISMDQFYQNAASGTFFKHLGDFRHPQSVLWQVAQMIRDQPTILRKALLVPLQVVGRTLDTIMHPLMGHMVPRAKLGVFSGLAKAWNDRNPAATPEERSAEMIKIWDSVDNRLGQLVYDGLMWHNTLKDMAFITTRSVGWNIGTVREIGGGVVDAAQMAMDLARLRKPDFTRRMQYLIMLPIVVGLYGALFTYLATGKGPQHDDNDIGGIVPLDYFYPPTGAVDEDSGVRERLSLPGYMKDVIAVSRHPVETAINKMAPLPSEIGNLARNRDYYGGIIYYPETDTRVGAYLDFLLNTNQPFSLRAYEKMHADGVDPTFQALSFWGIQPAPKSISLFGMSQGA